jgi:hypothetical protein
MHVEETANNLVLWSLYTDEELMEIHERLVATIPPAEMMEWLRWMALSLAPHELTAMLAGMRATAPAPVFGDVMALMRGTLGAERWRAVECGLTAA